MRLTVIGIGLIGGSLALTLKQKGFVDHVIGVDNNPLHQTQALQLDIVDEIMDLEKAIASSDLIAIYLFDPENLFWLFRFMHDYRLFIIQSNF